MNHLIIQLFNSFIKQVRISCFVFFVGIKEGK